MLKGRPPRFREVFVLIGHLQSEQRQSERFSGKHRARIAEFKSRLAAMPQKSIASFFTKPKQATVKDDEPAAAAKENVPSEPANAAEAERDTKKRRLVKNSEDQGPQQMVEDKVRKLDSAMQALSLQLRSYQSRHLTESRGPR